MIFPIVMYGCESWTIKKAESWRIDAFEQWCWRRLLSPLDCKQIQPVHPKGNQSWIFIGRLMLKPKLQYFVHLMRRTDSFEKTLMLGKIEGGRLRVRQRMRWLMASLIWWTWVWVGSGSWWWTGRAGMLQSVGLQRVGHDWATGLTDWLNLGREVRQRKGRGSQETIVQT